MEQNTAGLEASTATKGLRYARHSPDQTLLYQLVERYYPELAELLAEQGRPLPRYVRKEFDEYLKCGRLKYGFLRLRCDTCHVEDEYDPMHQLHGSSVTYRIAVGPRQGRKVFTLQTMPASDPEEWVGKVDGFSLHAGVESKAHERKKLERQ